MLALGTVGRTAPVTDQFPRRSYRKSAERGASLVLMEPSVGEARAMLVPALDPNLPLRFLASEIDPIDSSSLRRAAPSHNESGGLARGNRPSRLKVTNHCSVEQLEMGGL